ncbi:MAG TPA: hypothetical protein PLN06_01085 [Bacteroidales bacterium]|nr:hypothetical protein [Bacteroidales bacterium]
MIRKIDLIFIVVTLFFVHGCIKETYNLDKLSDDIKLSPTLVLPAINSDITLADIVKPSDTVKYDNDNFMRIFFKEDSLFNLKLEDLYDFSDIASFDEDYVFGEIKINDFQSTATVTLDVISQHFSSPFRETFRSLDDGNIHDFPSFTGTSIGEITFGTISDFENVLFASGYLEISVKNNLTAPLNDIKIHLYNSTGHTEIVPEITIPSVNPEETKTVSVSLADRTVKNSIVAAVFFTGSPGATNVKVDLDQTVEFKIHGYELKARSGRLMIPPTLILTSTDNKNTIELKPDDDIEIERGKIKSGILRYSVISRTNLSTSISITLPTSNRSGSPVSEIIDIPSGRSVSKLINISNTEIDLSSDVNKPFNRIPIEYGIKVSSDGSMVNYNSADNISVSIRMPNPEIDYLKGYFGQLQEDIEPDTMKTDIEDILEKITGEFHISNPSIKINYSNSFGIPVKVTLNAKGKRDNKTVDLDFDPFVIDYPVYTSRDISSSFKIDKTNSNLPDLVSLPPVEITFSGSSQMNPAGLSGGRNNYVFGNSRFLASLEIEIPVEFWINNLQLADTVDNFLKSDEEDDDDNPLKAENIDLLRLRITVSNGFPLGASLKLVLYDSIAQKHLKTIDASDIIKPAQVDASGKVIKPAETVTNIDFNKDFFEASSDADNIIFLFTLITSGGNDKKEVKFYSDYSISCKATVLFKPNIIF